VKILSIIIGKKKQKESNGGNRNQQNMLTVACVLKTSGVYKPEWVYKLKRSIERNLTIPHRFICLSDVSLDCDHIPLEEDNPHPGYWYKLQLFKPGNLTGEVLYFDLDVVVSKSLDEFVKNLRSRPESFLMFEQTEPKIKNSSVLYWKEDHSYLYETYRSNRERYRCNYNTETRIGDQAFIEDHAKGVGTLNDCFSKNFVLCTQDLDFVVSEKTGMVVFLGTGCKPHQNPDHSYIKENWL